MPKPPAFRPAVWNILCLAVLTLVLSVLLSDSLFSRRGLVPADGILAFLPWSRAWHGPPSNPSLVDQYAFFLPQRQFFHDQLWKGHFPLWDPHLDCGVPSLASMQVAALYPINLLLSPLSPFVASGIAAFVKLLLAGFFTFMYVRRLGVAPAAALVSAVAFALCGFLIVWLGHPHVNAAILLPLLLYLLEAQFSQPWGLRYWIGFALAFGVMLLGGHPPTAVHLTIVTVIYFFFRLAEAGRTARLRKVLLFGAFMTAGALLAAPQLLPYLEYYRQSSSPLASQGLQRWASHLTPNTLIYFLLPFLSGSPSAGFEHLPTVLGLGPMESFNERTAYAGVLTLFLAAVAILKRRCRFTAFYTGLAALSLLVVYGVPPVPSVMRALPILSSVNHERLLLLVDWSLAVLAGLGADSIFRGGARLRSLALVFSAAVLLALGALWLTIEPGFSQLDGAARGFLMRQLWIPAGGLIVAVLMVAQAPVPAGSGRPSVSWVPFLCVAWMAVDLLWFARGFNPAIPAERYYPRADSIRFLQQDASIFRVLALGDVLVPNTAAVYGLDDVRGQDFTTLRRYEELITGRAGDFLFFQGTTRTPPAINLLNAKYVLVPERLASPPDGYDLAYDGEIAIYRYRGYRERALAVFDHRVENSPAAVLAQVRSGAFDPERTVLLEEEPQVAAADPDPTIPLAQTRILTYEADRVIVAALMPRSGFLLLLDNYFPGWKAYVNDREVPIYRADYTFRAVAVPSGKSTVEFMYQPTSFRVGLVASLIVLTLLVLLYAANRQPNENHENTKEGEHEEGKGTLTFPFVI